MVNIIKNNPFAKGRSQSAFRDKLVCPYCGLNSNKEPRLELVGNIGPYIRRYRCGDCNGTFRYEFSNAPTHPYDSFKKGLKT